MRNSQNPLARKDGLVIQEMPDEVLVYDLNANKAHCLNKTASIIWRACDGKNSIAEINQLLEKEFGAAAGEDLVWLAIDQLNADKLLEEEVVTKFAGLSRREAIKKVGLASMVALPIVASLVAPTSVLAFTSCKCAADGDCLAQAGCPAMCDTGAGLCMA